MAARFERVIPSPVGRRVQKAPDDGVVLDAENLNASIQRCHDISQAREVLQTGLNASQKLTTGNQKLHLLITIQPMIDGKKLGDKICILDMGGIEKENKLHNTHGRAAKNTNQAANEAVLNYLRVLSNNSNAIDNDGSSITDIQRNKVTALLNPLFVQSSFVKVTLLMTAYPGDVDYQQKKMLLENFKILHGPFFSVPENIAEAHGEKNQPLRSEVSNRQYQDLSGNDDRAASAYKRGNERQNAQQSVQSRGGKAESRNARISVKVSPSAPRMPKAESIHNSREDLPIAILPNARKVVRVQAVKVSRRSGSHSKSFVPTSGRKQRARPSLDYPGSIERRVEPSAPNLFEIEEPCVNSREMQGCAVDYPGLVISPTVERKSEAVVLSTKKDPSFSATKRSQRKNRDTTEHPIDVTEARNHSTHHQHEGQTVRDRGRRKDVECNRIAELKSPLGRSSLENCDFTTPNKTERVHDIPDGTENLQYHLHETEIETETTTDSFEVDFSSFEKMTNSKSQIEKLETTLKQTLQEKEALEEFCSQLEKENAELKQLSREAGRKALQSRWTEQDEEKFLASQKLRREAQNRIAAPIQDHLNNVNYIYDIKNQWCMTNKQHFSLSFPDHFQRAPELDVRDKNNEKSQVLNSTAKDTQSNDGTEINKKELTKKKMIFLSPSKLSPKKRVKSPKGLSALRKLVGKTLKS